jgi:copper homeostasis protein
VTILIEAAVETLEDALAAVEGGADRLELCARLDIGGTTPDRATIAAVREHVGLPLLVMIRPRAGSFVYSKGELDRMRRDVELASELGVAGVVLGVLDADDRVDAGATRMLVDVAGALPVTFHRAIDRTPDILSAAETLASLGVARVLTSGAAPTAIEGVETLASLVRRVGDRLGIVAGGGVRSDNAHDIVTRSGVRDVHARCGGVAARIRAIRSSLPRARPAAGTPPALA